MKEKCLCRLRIQKGYTWKTLLISTRILRNSNKKDSICSILQRTLNTTNLFYQPV